MLTSLILNTIPDGCNFICVIHLSTAVWGKKHKNNMANSSKSSRKIIGN